MNGLFLQGGGAKGAFQAGIIYALSKKGITFNVISGTSIGAINGYYIYKDNVEAMRELYICEHTEVIIPEYVKIDKVIDNEYVINTINKLQGKNKNVEAFYVNYTEVKESTLTEKIVNLCELDKDKAIKCVKYSSLLPYPCDEYGLEVKAYELLQNFDSKVVFERFKCKVISGEYDGHNLDGGIMNNNLLKPFMDEKLDKIYILPLSNSFQVPEYLYEKYKKEDIIVIRRLEPFYPQDTLRFQPSFLRQLFYEGYNAIK